jgi:hypothetical protein
MSKTKRQPYTGSKAVDKSCRSHGSCPHCEGKRKHKTDRQATLIDNLGDLALHMQEVAIELEYYGGFDPEALDHSKELTGASHIVEQWAEAIK